MKLFIFFALLFISGAILAQADSIKALPVKQDSLFKTTTPEYGYYGKLTDTGQYGTRIYNARIANYLLADANYSTQNNPYGYTKQAIIKPKRAKK